MITVTGMEEGGCWQSGMGGANKCDKMRMDAKK